MKEDLRSHEKSLSEIRGTQIPKIVSLETSQNEPSPTVDHRFLSLQFRINRQVQNAYHPKLKNLTPSQVYECKLKARVR